jgi:hypothetical protein
MYRYICQNNLTGLYGTIPLKYIYNSDTILLPAFPVYCSLVDIFYKNIMTIKVADSGIIFYHNETSLDINNPIIKDTLREIISRNLSAFFENLIELNEKERDTNQIKKKVMSKKINPGWQFCFELQDDNQWRKINRPLDIILTSYLAGLKKSMKQNYKKEICELDPFELRLISGILYISFIFDKSRE